MASRVPKKRPPYLEYVFSCIEKKQGRAAGYYDEFLKMLDANWEAIYNQIQNSKDTTPKKKTKAPSIATEAKKLVKKYKEIQDTGDKVLIRENQQTLAQTMAFADPKLKKVTLDTLGQKIGKKQAEKIDEKANKIYKKMKKQESESEDSEDPFSDEDDGNDLVEVEVDDDDDDDQSSESSEEEKPVKAKAAKGRKKKSQKMEIE